MSPRPNRFAIAHPPANAAPNTSALIRIAALSTVSTFSQWMLRSGLVAPVLDISKSYVRVDLRPAISMKVGLRSSLTVTAERYERPRERQPSTGEEDHPIRGA